ncbi:MAG: toxin-antitoxin system YwqK family antitoxin [Flavobacteriales bacterium]|nr:toxin-antitoxin system YwqK family antitoxin [Flavobacteriales bacterium]
MSKKLTFHFELWINVVYFGALMNGLRDYPQKMSGSIVTENSNNQLLEVLMVDQLPYEGVLTESYDNGQAKSSGNYINGKLHGIYKTWHKNGKIAVACLFKYGVQHGEFKSWWENGQPKKSCSYHEGKLNGIYETWHNCGAKSCWKQYIMGKEWGRQMHWNESGVQIENYCVSNSH